MSESRKQVIKNTLNAFFGVEVDENENTNENNNIPLAIDKVDVEILSDAIDQSLEKATNNESPNQFKQ